MADRHHTGPWALPPKPHRARPWADRVRRAVHLCRHHRDRHRMAALRFERITKCRITTPETMLYCPHPVHIGGLHALPLSPWRPRFPRAAAARFAAEGTAAHELAERCLRQGANASDYRGEALTADGFAFDVTNEMVDAVQLYLDYVRDQPGRLLIEQQVDFSPWVPGGFGTADAVVLNEDVATIVDLKYGRGVKVEADNNPQAMCYALGAAYAYSFLFDIPTFRLVIVQPRLDHISAWEITTSDLLTWAEDVLKPAVEAALSEAPAFHPGEVQCRFCRAKGTCRALAKHSLAIASDGFEALGDPVKPTDLKQLSNGEIAALLPHLDLVADWIKAVEAIALSQLERGATVPGYKLVAGRSLRKWADEAEAEAALRALPKLKVADIFTKKLISPAQAEKKLGKTHKLLAEHVVKPAGRPTLAPVSDTRPALEIDPTAGFDAAA